MVKIELITQQHIIKDPEHKFLMRLFGMVNTYPANATFATQNEGENIVIVMRKHFFKNVNWIINSGFLLILPWLILTVFLFVDSTFFQNEITRSDFFVNMDQRLITVFVLFYFSVVASYIIFNFVHWYYDVFIITNERFISIDFDIIRGQTIVDIPLQDIIDIQEIVNGFWPTIMGFGIIEFKTTSEKFISIPDVAQPTWFRDSFADLIKFIRKYEGEDQDPEDPFDVIPVVPASGEPAAAAATHSSQSNKNVSLEP